MLRSWLLGVLFFALLLQLSPLDTFLNAFLGTEAKTYTNYLLTLICLMLVTTAYVGIRNVSLVRIGGPLVILMIIYGVSIIGSEYSDPRWYFYQFLFLCSSFATAVTYGSLGRLELDHLRSIIDGIMRLASILVFLVSTILFVSHWEILTEGVGALNAYIAQLNYEILWEKQAIGNVVAIVVVYLFQFMPFGRIRSPVLLLPVLPLGVGIRTLWLGLVGAMISLRLSTRRSWLLVGVLILFFSMLVIGIEIPNGYSNIRSLLTSDIRVMAYLNAIDIMGQFPLGVGLGGYPVYTREFGERLLTQFASITTTYTYVPDAAESDLVFIFSSLGLVPGAVHFLLLLSVLLSVAVRYQSYEKLDRFFALVFAYYFWAGISQDNIFGFQYWVFFGFVMGRLVSKRQLRFQASS